MKWLLVAVAAVSPRAAADPPRITFDDAIHRAIANNPDRRIALWEIQRVDALLAQSTAALLPQLNGNLTFTRLEGERRLANRVAEAPNGLVVSVGLIGPVVDMSLWANRWRAADQVDATSADAEAVKRDVAIATARAYFAAYTADQLLQVAITARDTAKGHVDFASSRAQGGVGTDLDLARAQTELATDEAQVASATTARLRADAALGVITGSPGALAPAGMPDLAEHEGPGIDARADLIAAARHTFAARHSAELDWSYYTPTLRLAGDAFLTEPPVAPTPPIGYQLALVLSVPIYEGGLRRARHAEHLAELAEARERALGVTRQAASDVAIARAALADTRTARDAARRAADAATRALQLAQIAYQAGTANSLDLIDAERVARDAATQAAIADDDYRLAQLDLLAATGAFPPP